MKKKLAKRIIKKNSVRMAKWRLGIEDVPKSFLKTWIIALRTVGDIRFRKFS